MLGPSLAPAVDASRLFNPMRAQKKVGKAETPEQKKLLAACKDFESVMLGQVFKQMRATIGTTDPLNGGKANEMYQDMLDDERAKVMAGSGGFGLADAIYRQLVQSVAVPSDRV